MGPQTWDFKSGQLSDLGPQVWTAVRLRIPGRTNPRSKIFNKLFLDPGQKSWIRIQDPRFSKKIMDEGQKSKIQDWKDMRCNSSLRKTCRTPFRYFGVGKSLQNAAANVIHSVPESKLQKVQKQIIPNHPKSAKRWHDLRNARTAWSSRSVVASAEALVATYFQTLLGILAWQLHPDGARKSGRVRCLSFWCPCGTCYLVFWFRVR